MQNSVPRRIIYALLLAIFFPAHAKAQSSTAPLTREAESFNKNLSQGGKSWTRRSLNGASGNAVLFVGPNSGVSNNNNYTTRSPRLDYTLSFPKAGKYFVWIRGVGASGSDDSLHVGLDGKALSSSDRISGFKNALTWSNRTMDRGSRAVINVPTAGTHTVNVWMREDGFVFDKIVLTTDSNFTPTGLGPTSTQTTATTNTPLATTAPSTSTSTVLGTALLTWQAPTRNTDGTPMTDLAGFVVYMADTSGTFNTNDIIAKVPALSPLGGSQQQFTANGLKTGKYYFSVTAYNNAGQESSFSPVVSKTIAP